jgi:hypothetical protein
MHIGKRKVSGIKKIAHRATLLALGTSTVVVFFLRGTTTGFGLNVMMKGGQAIIKWHERTEAGAGMHREW